MGSNKAAKFKPKADVLTILANSLAQIAHSGATLPERANPIKVEFCPLGSDQVHFISVERLRDDGQYNGNIQMQWGPDNGEAKTKTVSTAQEASDTISEAMKDTGIARHRITSVAKTPRLSER